jgi:hypothetical protein
MNKADTLHAICFKLQGIALDDLTTAERQIYGCLENAGYVELTGEFKTVSVTKAGNELGKA